MCRPAPTPFKPPPARKARPRPSHPTREGLGRMRRIGTSLLPDAGAHKHQITAIANFVICRRSKAGATGLEPATSGVTERDSITRNPSVLHVLVLIGHRQVTGSIVKRVDKFSLNADRAPQSQNYLALRGRR
jgi:hypothetical protein